MSKKILSKCRHVQNLRLPTFLVGNVGSKTRLWLDDLAHTKYIDYKSKYTALFYIHFQGYLCNTCGCDQPSNDTRKTWSKSPHHVIVFVDTVLYGNELDLNPNLTKHWSTHITSLFWVHGFEQVTVQYYTTSLGGRFLEQCHWPSILTAPSDCSHQTEPKTFHFSKKCFRRFTDITVTINLP